MTRERSRPAYSVSRRTTRGPQAPQAWRGLVGSYGAGFLVRDFGLKRPSSITGKHRRLGVEHCCYASAQAHASPDHLEPGLLRAADWSFYPLRISSSIKAAHKPPDNADFQADRK